MRPSALAVLVLVALSCGGLSTKLCGEPGQPCCEGTTCAANASCGGDGLCSACGTEGIACCPGASCSGGLACASNLCVMPISCGTQCTLGSSQCNGNGVELCVAMGVCPSWKALATCPGGSVCEAGNAVADCIETCPGACVGNTTLCTNEGLRLCVPGSPCPSLAAQEDNASMPVCVTGAVISPEIVWESPTPFGAQIVDFASAPGFDDNYWVLDSFGNIVHFAANTWAVEVRPTAGQRTLAIASCAQGLLIAVGENGSTLRRSGGAWLSESVGAIERLVDVTCDSSGAYAVGVSGTLYVHPLPGAWSSISTRDAGTFTSVTSVFSASQVFIAGSSGQIVRCDLVGAPSCVDEISGTAAPIAAMWGDSASGGVWAVGPHGLLLERSGAGWNNLSLAEDVNLVAVTGLSRTDLLFPSVVAIASDGTGVVHRSTEPDEIIHLPATDGLASVWLPAQDTVVFGGAHGSMWYRNGLRSLAPFVARGGFKPVQGSIRAVTSVGDGRLFAVGANGLRVRRQNGAWAADLTGLASDVTLNGVAARSIGEVYAVGASGTVLVRRWGTWVREAQGLTSENLVAVGFDSTRVWAVGRNVLLEKTIATGVWVAKAVGFLEEPTAMAIRRDANGRATEVVLVGAGCAIVPYDPSTSAFTVSPDCGARSYDFTAAAFLSNGDLLLASSEGTIHRRSGNALTFETTTPIPPGGLNGLLVDGATAWAVGEEGAIYRRLNGTWTPAVTEVTNGRFRAGVRDADGVFFVGDDGMILRRP